MIPVIDKKRTGEKIRFFMEREALNPSDIQMYLGLSCVQTVYRWLEGINIPSIDNLYALSCLFRVRMDDMIAGTAESVQISRRFILNRFQKRVLAYCEGMAACAA